MSLLVYDEPVYMYDDTTYAVDYDGRIHPFGPDGAEQSLYVMTVQEEQETQYQFGLQARKREV